MNKILFAFSIAALFSLDTMAQVEYKEITSVESIVPGGLGSSRNV